MSRPCAAPFSPGHAPNDAQPPEQGAQDAGELAFAETEPAFEPQTIARYRVALVREESTPYDEPQSCSDPRAAARFVHQILSTRDREVMGAIFLDIRNRAIGH